MITIKINNKPYEVEEDSTILDVAKQANIYIPTLCHLDLHNIKMVNNSANCRICMVEIDGKDNLVPSCSTKVYEGMEILTNTRRAIGARRTNLELILSNHPKDCLICPKNGECELQSLAAELGVRDIKYTGKMQDHELDKSSLSIVRNQDKCVLCGRCEKMCNEVQTVGVYSKKERGFDTTMTTAFDSPLIESPCTFCGQCVSVCPTAALTEVDNTKEVWEVLNNPKKYVVVQTAPAIRVALGEMFDMPVGTNVTGKMVAALKELGFDRVMDTDFAADLTIVEETKEFLDRLEGKGRLPILTSCCPAWVNFIEYQYPELLDIPSTCKSPHEMFGAIAKSYLAEKLNIKPKDMVVVSIMPCLAKKYEAAREELSSEKLKNVDYVISTRELGRMIKEAGINFTHLEDEEFDPFMSESTGAGVIFGVTGGVIEAVLRNASYLLNKKKLDQIDFKDVRGMKGVRETTVTIDGKELNIAIAHGLGNARVLLENIKNGTSNYHAIEIMACPGGCIGGGGQPYFHDTNEDVLKKRAKAIYTDDERKEKRISSQNQEIQALYDDFLGEIGGELAHELLHTKYHSTNMDN